MRIDCFKTLLRIGRLMLVWRKAAPAIPNTKFIVCGNATIGYIGTGMAGNSVVIGCSGKH